LLPIAPADDEQGRVAASEKAGRARIPAAAHAIAPVTGLRTLLRCIVSALPIRLDTQRDLSVSRLRVEIDVWLGFKTRRRKWRVLFDELVSADKKGQRHVKSEPPSGPHRELKLNLMVVGGLRTYISFTHSTFS
jgi:hypothetical protein